MCWSQGQDAAAEHNSSSSEESLHLNIPMANPNPNPVHSDSENETFSDAIDHLHTQSPPPPPCDMDDNDDDDTPQSQQQQQPPYHIFSHYPNGIFMRSVSDSPPDHFHASPTPPMLDPAASAGGDATPAKALPGEEEGQQEEEDRETTSSLVDKKKKSDLSSPSWDAARVGAAAAADDDDDDVPMMSSTQSHENEDQNENDAQHKDLGVHDPFSNFVFVQDSNIYLPPLRRRPESSTPSPAAKRHEPEGGLEIRNVPAPDDGVFAGSRQLPTSIRSFLSPKQTKGDASIDSPPTSRPVPSYVQEKATQEAAAVSELPACLKDLITHLLAGMPDSGRKCDNVDILQTAATKGFHFRSPRWHRPGGYSAKTDT